jgi:hypothetical protein
MTTRKRNRAPRCQYRTLGICFANGCLCTPAVRKALKCKGYK